MEDDELYHYKIYESRDISWGYASPLKRSCSPWGAYLSFSLPLNQSPLLHGFTCSWIADQLFLRITCDDGSFLH